MPINKNNQKITTDNDGCRSIAIVSGKGGSGKTMIAAELARLADNKGAMSVLIDGDIGTGGLTYFLNLKYLAKHFNGISDLALKKSEYEKGRFEKIEIDNWIQPLKQFNQTYFLGVGDHRKILKNNYVSETIWALKHSINYLESTFDLLLVDCRGGIDDESIAICEAVDEIIMVVETDTTSFQASQHLSEVLSNHDLNHKLKGFILNKVIDDPKHIIRNGAGLFKCPYLGSIPFDIEVTRNFLVGEIPEQNSIFGTHVSDAAHRAFPGLFPKPKKRVWNFKDFSQVGLSDIDSTRGGIFAAASIMALAITLTGLELLSIEIDQTYRLIIFGYLVVFGLMGSIERSRRTLGRLINSYLDIINRI